MSDDPNKFAAGDIVRVANIPGPRMVVSKIVSDAKGVLIRCFWFNRRNEFQGLDFAPSVLAKASPWTDRNGDPIAYSGTELEFTDAAD